MDRVLVEDDPSEHVVGVFDVFEKSDYMADNLDIETCPDLRVLRYVFADV